MNKKPIFLVCDNDVGMRLDNFILKQRRQMDKPNLYKLIRKGQVRVNGKRCKPDQKVNQGDQVRVPPFVFFVDQPVAEVPDVAVKEIQPHVLFRSDDFLLINKPATWPCHAGSGHDFGVIDVVKRLPGCEHAQLGHRLDKNTSGCLLVALHRLALLRFQEAMKALEVKKVYEAMVEGEVTGSFSVDVPLDVAHRVNGIRHVVPSPKGKAARSHFEPIGVIRHNGHAFTRVLCRIEHGRTHQIRVHASHWGHPIWGDVQYGAQHKHPERALCLHARSLVFDGQNWHADCPF